MKRTTAAGSALLLAGILFHDSGKLWENQLPANGFTMGFDERGELMGHISIGLELVNSLWRKILASNDATAWSGLVIGQIAIGIAARKSEQRAAGLVLHMGTHGEGQRDRKMGSPDPAGR